MCCRCAHTTPGSTVVTAPCKDSGIATVAPRASADDITFGAVAAVHRQQTIVTARSRQPLAGTASTSVRR